MRVAWTTSVRAFGDTRRTLRVPVLVCCVLWTVSCGSGDEGFSSKATKNETEIRPQETRRSSKAEPLTDERAFELFRATPGPKDFATTTIGSADYMEQWSRWLTSMNVLCAQDLSLLERLVQKVGELEYSPRSAQRQKALQPNYSADEILDLQEKAFWLNRMVFEVPQSEIREAGQSRYPVCLKTLSDGKFDPLYPFTKGEESKLRLATTRFGWVQLGGPPLLPIFEFDQFAKRFPRRQLPIK